MDFVEFYYSDVVGYYPFEDNDNRKQAKAVIDHLVDAGLSDEEILRFLEGAPTDGVLRPEHLPEWLWEDQLTQKGTFYYHHSLHITSPAPTWNPRTGMQQAGKFYLEMRIKYGMIDLVRYFYRTLGVPLDLLDQKRDEAAFHHMLNRYKRFAPRYEALDFVLALIDYGKHMDEEEMSISSVFDVKRYEAQVREIFEKKVDAASHAEANVIIWR